MENEKPVSSFEYAIAEIANTHGNTTKHTEGIRPRTNLEERQRTDKSLRNQLSKMQIVKANGEREDVNVNEVMNNLKQNKP